MSALDYALAAALLIARWVRARLFAGSLVLKAVKYETQVTDHGEGWPVTTRRFVRNDWPRKEAQEMRKLRKLAKASR